MDEKTALDFLDLLSTIVSEPKPWRVKKESLLKNALESDKANIDEFVTWFDTEEETEV